MNELPEKPYVSKSTKKIQPKKDLSRIIMYRDFKKSRKNSRNSMFTKKYHIPEDYTTDDVVFTKSDPSEWVFPEHVMSTKGEFSWITFIIQKLNFLKLSSESKQ